MVRILGVYTVLPMLQQCLSLPLLSVIQAVPCSHKRKKSGHRGLRGSAENTEQIRFLLPLPKTAPAWEIQG